MPPKAIPPARDRVQSRILVAVAVPVLCYAAADAVRFAPISETVRYLWSCILISACFGYAAWRLKAATLPAAVCGAVIALLAALTSSIPQNISPFHSALGVLCLLFLLTFSATKQGEARKATAGLAEGHKGRNTAQIIANLGIAAFVSSELGFYTWGWLLPLAYSGPNGHTLFVGVISVPIVAALAEATADTVSSEIGQAFGGTPFMLTTFRRVPVGTDGAVTLIGTAAGIVAATMIAASGLLAIGMTPHECLIAFAAGVTGLFFDSLLGATLERRGYIGNDLVNFSSTAFAAALALLAIRFAQPWLVR